MDGLLFSVHTIFHLYVYVHMQTSLATVSHFTVFLSHTMSTKHSVKNDPLENIVRALSDFYIVIPVGGDK